MARQATHSHVWLPARRSQLGPLKKKTTPRRTNARNQDVFGRGPKLKMRCHNGLSSHIWLRLPEHWVSQEPTPIPPPTTLS